MASRNDRRYRRRVDHEPVANEPPEQSDLGLPDGREVAEVLKGIPGAAERLALAKEQIARGEGIPLDDL